MLKSPKNKKVLRWSFIAAGALLVIGAAVYFYYATLTHDDTASLKADYQVEAIPFIKEFEKDHKAANKKYGEKIIAVKGIVTETEPADTTMNIKIIDTVSNSFIIFAFQEQHLSEPKTVKVGDTVSIKGSFSAGIFSEIMEVVKIDFKRSALNK